MRPQGLGQQKQASVLGAPAGAQGWWAQGTELLRRTEEKGLSMQDTSFFS